jgi:hypothetical protein
VIILGAGIYASSRTDVTPFHVIECRTGENCWRQLVFEVDLDVAEVGVAAVATRIWG